MLDELRVVRKDLSHQALTGGLQSSVDDPAVVRASDSCYELLLLESIDHIGNVASGHEKLLGEFSQRQGPKVMQGLEYGELRGCETVVTDARRDGP